VFTDEQGWQSVNYIGVIPIVVEAVKAQQKQIDDLKADAGKRDAENADLKARLERLEQQLNDKQ